MWSLGRYLASSSGRDDVLVEMHCKFFFVHYASLSSEGIMKKVKDIWRFSAGFSSWFFARLFFLPWSYYDIAQVVFDSVVMFLFDVVWF